MKYFKHLLLSLLVLTGTFLLSCSSQTDDKLVVYSGRSKALVDEIVADFKEQTDIKVDVRYGNDAELLAILNEEGDKSPADVIWANTTGALSNASSEGLLTKLPDSLLNKPASYTSSSGEWIPVTVRFRVLAYNSEALDAADLPESVMDLPSMEEFEGRVGWTPTYSSFYDFITAMRMQEGEDATRDWIEGMKELNPKAYNSNTPMVQAIAAGEIDLGLTNHYYVLRMKQGGAEGEYEGHEEGEEEHEEEEQAVKPNANLKTYHFAPGNIGNLALVTGAAQLKTADNSRVAQQFLSFLLSSRAQQYAAQSVHEYPVVEGVAVPDYLLNEEKAFKLSPDYDFKELQKLEGTLNLLREAGLI